MSKRGRSTRRMPDSAQLTLAHGASATPIPLTTLSELPEWYSMTCNPFVHSGYRLPASTFLQSASSMFEWHNETLSIHTHLWPGLYFSLYFFTLWQQAQFWSATVPMQLMQTFFSLGAACMCFASAFAHTFYIIDAKWASVSWKLDYIGIVAVNFSHQYLDTLLLRFAAPGFEPYFWPAVAVEILFALWCVARIALSERSVGRSWGLLYPLISSVPLTFTVLAFSRSSALGIKGPLLQAAAQASLNCSIFVGVAGGVFFKGRFPERFWNPLGVLDNFSSHAWHHCFIIGSILAAMQGLPYVLQLDHV